MPGLAAGASHSRYQLSTRMLPCLLFAKYGPFDPTGQVADASATTTGCGGDVTASSFAPAC
jgi:hypothetical protein